jgi:hypothetical protein
VITNKIPRRQLILFFLLTIGLAISLIEIALWRGEQKVNPENFWNIFRLSLLGTVILGALLVMGALYLSWKRS